jgi:hypothetical protein
MRLFLKRVLAFVTRQPAKIPAALSAARGQFDQWRSRHRKRARLPKELWRRAAALARKHGLNKTARALDLKYYSLKKHLDQMTAEEVRLRRIKSDFFQPCRKDTFKPIPTEKIGPNR